MKIKSDVMVYTPYNKHAGEVRVILTFEGANIFKMCESKELKKKYKKLLKVKRNLKYRMNKIMKKMGNKVEKWVKENIAKDAKVYGMRIEYVTTLNGRVPRLYVDVYQPNVFGGTTLRFGGRRLPELKRSIEAYLRLSSKKSEIENELVDVLKDCGEVIKDKVVTAMKLAGGLN